MLTLIKGDDRVFTFTFYDETKTVINLTSCALYSTVKVNKIDTDAMAKISKTLSITAPATNGIATLTFVPADTQYLSGLYYWDVQLVDASSKVTTLINDILEVVPDVTIRVTA
jgi:hypothetical protein